MLDVNNVNVYRHLTKKEIEKMKNLTSMNFSGEIDDQKEQEEGKNIFKTKQRESEGATVGRPFCLLTFPAQLAVFRPDRQRSPWKSPYHRETPINYYKCPTFDAGDFHKTNETKMQMSLRKQTKNIRM
jgi:hypothetical protein